MKIKIIGVTICSARRIRRKLEQGIKIRKDKTHPKEWGYVLGVYDSRILGICIYRNSI